MLISLLVIIYPDTYLPVYSQLLTFKKKWPGPQIIQYCGPRLFKSGKDLRDVFCAAASCGITLIGGEQILESALVWNIPEYIGIFEEIRKRYLKHAPMRSLSSSSLCTRLVVSGIPRVFRFVTFVGRY